MIQFLHSFLTALVRLLLFKTEPDVGLTSRTYLVSECTLRLARHLVSPCDRKVWYHPDKVRLPLWLPLSCLSKKRGPCSQKHSTLVFHAPTVSRPDMPSCLDRSFFLFPLSVMPADPLRPEERSEAALWGIFDSVVYVNIWPRPQPWFP